MARIYKMTLYVCDLLSEEDTIGVSLDEIKRRIEERALQTTCCNCICHFANEKIGPQIEWHDEIELNRIHCPTSEWEKYFSQSAKWKDDHCSNCGYGVQPWNNTKYCPRCGAKMENGY